MKCSEKTGHNKKRRKGISMQTRESIVAYAFMMLWLLGLLLFTLYPLFNSIRFSVSDVTTSANGIRTSFAGLKWFKEAFMTDADFIFEFAETAIFILVLIPLIVIVSLIIALLLNSKFPGRAFFRALYFFPVVISSGPALSMLLNNGAATIVNMEESALIGYIRLLPDVFSDMFNLAFSNLVIMFWYSGIQMLVYLAGLQKISSSVYEAARIDGASKWQIFWKITLPYLKPTIMLNAIYTVVELSRYENTAVNQVIRSEMFDFTHIYSYSAAISWIYALFILLVIGFIFVLLKDKKEVA